MICPCSLKLTLYRRPQLKASKDEAGVLKKKTADVYKKAKTQAQDLVK